MQDSATETEKDSEEEWDVCNVLQDESETRNEDLREMRRKISRIRQETENEGEGMKIPADSWRKIQAIIRQYPESLRLLREWDEEVLQASMRRKAQDNSQTEQRALQLQTEYRKRLKRETEAVTAAYEMLTDDEQKVIRLRFWNGRSVTRYEYMLNANYSVRQMQRIVSKMVRMVGVGIGELHPVRWRI